MAATITGTLKILDMGSSTLDKVSNSATKLDATINKTGKAVDRNTSEMGRNFEKMAVKGKASLSELTHALKEFDRQRATATADVDITKAEAKIRILKHQIRSVSTLEARKELGDLGLLADGVTSSLVGGGGGGGGGAGKSGLAAGFQGAAGAVSFFTVAATAALPAVVALGGAVSALIGSLGAAVGGAGALGVGGLGALLVGGAGVAAIAVPAVKGLQAAKKAQDAYNKSVQQYGDKSAQAIKAHKAMMDEFAKHPGAGGVLNNAKLLGSQFQKGTRAGQSDFFGLLNDGLQTAVKLLPLFSFIANRSMKAARGAVDDFIKPFSSSMWRRILLTLSNTFDKIVGPAGRALGNIALWFGRIAQAASPMVVKMFESLQKWTSDLANKAGNISGVQRTITGLVGQLKDWFKFFGATITLFSSFFGSGAKQGQSALQGITDQFVKWSDWLKKHPAELRDFFDKTISSAGKLAKALGTIAGALVQVSMSLLPILNAISSVISGGGAGNLATLAAIISTGYAVAKVGGFGPLGKAGKAAGATGAGAAAAEGAGGAATAAEAVLAGTAWNRAGRAARGLPRRALRGGGLVAAGLGLYGAITTPGGLVNRLNGALSGATLGLLGDPVDPGSLRNAGIAHAQGLHSAVGINNRMYQIQSQLSGAPSGLAKFALGGDGKFFGIGGGFKISDKERIKLQAELKALKLELPVAVKAERAAKDQASVGHAQDIFSDLTGAFGIRSKALGQQKGFAAFGSDVLQKMSGLRASGKMQLAQMGIEWAQQQEVNNPKLKKPVDEFIQHVKDAYSRMGKHIEVVNGQILTGSSSEWGKISDVLSSATEKALEEVTTNFTKMQQAAIGSLTAMGMSPSAARSYISGQEAIGAGKSTTKSAFHAGDPGRGGSGKKNARGGRLTGVGMQDTVNLGMGNMAAPGELILNRHTERKLDQRLGFPGATALMVSGEHVPHGMAVHALGGRVVGLQAGVSGAANRVLGQFPGLSITSTTGGVHAANSYHYKGEAVDIGGPPALMNRAAAWIKRTMGSNLTEGIHNPNLSISGGHSVSPSYWGPAVWAEHANHIHLAVAGALGALHGAGGGGGGMGGGSPAHIAAIRSKLGGLPGAASTRASQIYAHALNHRLGTYGGGGGGAGGGGQYNKARLERLWRSIGGSPGSANMAAAIAMAESGGNPHSTNHNTNGTTDRGLWQINSIWGNKSTYDITRNALAAKSISHNGSNWGPWATYNNGAYRKYLATGGRVGFGGWFGNGGSFVANKPTMIGVGDGGREKVTVTPERAGGGFGHGGLSIHIGTIINNEEGDIRRILHRELAAVAKDLGNGPVEDTL